MKRIVVEVGAHYLASLGLLLYLYPWSVHYSLFSFPRDVTAFSYALAAGIVVSVAVGAVFSTRRLHSSLARLGGGFAVACIALVTVCLGFGPYGLNVPGTRLRGIFFSEWMFVVFFFYAGVPLVAVAILGHWLLDRWRSTHA